jgi:hypothetical protein
MQKKEILVIDLEEITDDFDGISDPGFNTMLSKIQDKYVIHQIIDWDSCSEIVLLVSKI